jgi:hypothetical protein
MARATDPAGLDRLPDVLPGGEFSPGAKRSRVREIVAVPGRVEGDVVELEPIPPGWFDSLVIQVPEMAL